MKLLVRAPDQTQRHFECHENTVVIGRDLACDVVVRDAEMSRRHVEISFCDRGWLVSDTSSNGTRVGERLLRGGTMAITPPTTLRLGRSVVEVLAEETTAVGPILADTNVVVAELRRSAHHKLLEELDLSVLDQNVRSHKQRRDEVVAALDRIVRALARPADNLKIDDLVAELADEVLGLGPLETLLADPEVTEIMVVDSTTIFCERNGRLQRTGRRFTDDQAVRTVIERVVTPLGRRIDESSPYVDARLPDGSRINAIIPPLALRGPCLTIRKFNDFALSMEKLIARDSLNESMAKFLEDAVAARRNIVVSGGTGSGKTTLLNVLSSFIDRNERVVTIEDAAELRLKQPHVVSLESKPPNLEGNGAVTIRDLVRNSLRMRPDRILVGECRGGEALDMLQAMNTGHAGSMTTTHANSPREAVARIETLVLMAGFELPVRAIRWQIAQSIDIVVQQKRFEDGTRRITSIAELVWVEEDADVEIVELFGFRQTGVDRKGDVMGNFHASGILPTFFPEFLAQGQGAELYW